MRHPGRLEEALHMSTADMPRAVNLFDEMPDHAGAPTDVVMAHRTCQLPLPVG
jgi:hypothetical protein